MSRPSICRAAGALALSVAGGAALALPADARAASSLGVQHDRLTSSPAPELGRLLDELDATQAKVTRVDVLWSLVAPTRPAREEDPADPAYDWGRLDVIVRGLERDGLVPILAVYSAPPWAAGGHPIPEGTEVNPATPGSVLFGRFMGALAERYSGRYRPAGAERPLPEVRHFELWNEPNLGSFLSPQVRGGRRVAPAAYTRLVNRAYPAIKRANRDAVVIAGVGGPRSSTDARGTGALPWLRAVARGGARFDAYSQHVYPAAPPLADARAVPSWSTVPLLVRELDRVARHRGKPLYVTEAGYTTAATPFRDVRVSPAHQARYLRQIMDLPVVRGPRIPVVMWFNLRDNPNWPGGLRYASGRAKPSYAVFRRLARARPLHPALRQPRPRFTLDARQLLINQRISQAAVRRANAVQGRLDRGLTGADLRARSLTARVFGPSVRIAGTATGPAEPAPLDPPRRLAVPGRRGGRGGDVRLSAAQLLVNQRISQAAVRRTNGLGARLDGRLTGGDLVAGAVGARELAEGLRVEGTSAPGARPAPSATPIAPRRASGGRVRLSVSQLRVNQRIAQAAVRRANALTQRLEGGLTAASFRSATLAADNLAPPLRTGG